MKAISLLFVWVLCTGPMLYADEERIVLEKGKVIQGTVAKETADLLFIDVGPTIVEIHKKYVLKREPVREEVRTSEEKMEGLFSTKKLARRPIKELAEEFGEAVVKISSPAGLGSGFVIDRKEGYVVTNFHVIEGETSIAITIFHREGKEFKKTKKEKVRIVALSPHLDLALLKIEDMSGVQLKNVYLGDFDEVKVGDPVFAIGNPLGLEHTVTEGIVSTKTRESEGVLYLQTSTPINPGNSGGPLFNDRGEVVGVTNMGYMLSQGLNFAIPVNYLKDFLKNHEAYAYDKDNPNTGYRYFPPPRKKKNREE